MEVAERNLQIKKQSGDGQPSVGQSPTPRERDVLEAIAGFTRTNGYSPLLRELSPVLGISDVAIHGHVYALARKNLLDLKRGQRFIYISDEGKKALRRKRA